MKFSDKVYAFVSKIPKGKVVSYGQVAAACGSPRAARQVGWVLASLSLDTKVPWQRVVNSKGYLSIRGGDVFSKELQKHLLIEEGVFVNENFCIDFNKYRYNFK